MTLMTKTKPTKLYIPLLEDEVISLKPFTRMENYDYLVHLISTYRYSHFITDSDIKNMLCRANTHCWTAYDKQSGFSFGVIYLTQLDKTWTLDAYRDEPMTTILGNGNEYSYRAGKLVCDYFFSEVDKVLLTAHSVKNRAATIICKKLGFKTHKVYDTYFGQFIILKKERNHGT